MRERRRSRAAGAQGLVRIARTAAPRWSRTLLGATEHTHGSMAGTRASGASTCTAAAASDAGEVGLPPPLAGASGGAAFSRVETSTSQSGELPPTSTRLGSMQLGPHSSSRSK